MSLVDSPPPEMQAISEQSEPGFIRANHQGEVIFQFPDRAATLDFFRWLIPHMDGLATMLKKERVESPELEKRLDDEWQKQMKRLGEMKPSTDLIARPAEAYDFEWVTPPSFNVAVASKLIDHANLVMGQRLDETYP